MPPKKGGIFLLILRDKLIFWFIVWLKEVTQMTNNTNITEEYIYQILKNKVITAEDIYAINRTQTNRQKYINKICLAFADNDMSLDSLDTWEAFYNVIYKKSSFSDNIKYKAYSNAYDKQLEMLRSNRINQKAKSR